MDIHEKKYKKYLFSSIVCGKELNCHDLKRSNFFILIFCGLDFKRILPVLNNV